MGDDEARPSGLQAVHSLLHEHLCSGVDVRGRLVEDEDCRLGGEGARNRDELALTGRYVVRRLRDDRVQPVGEVLGEAIDIGGLGRSPDGLPVGVLVAVCDVVPNASLEQPGVLQDHSDRPAQIRPAHIAHIPAVDADGSGVDVVEAHEQVDDRRLACAGGPHDGDRLARLGGEGEALDELRLGIIGEVDLIELDPTGGRGERLGIGVRGLLGCVEQLVDAFGAGGRRLQPRGHAAQLPEGLGELAGVPDERLHDAEREGPSGHEGRAEDGSGHEDEVRHEEHRRHHRARQDLGAHTGGVDVRVHLLELLAGSRKAAVDAQQRQAGDRLLDMRVELAGRGPLLLELPLAGHAD